MNLRAQLRIFLEEFNEVGLQNVQVLLSFEKSSLNTLRR